MNASLTIPCICENVCNYTQKKNINSCINCKTDNQQLNNQEFAVNSYGTFTQFRF